MFVPILFGVAAIWSGVTGVKKAGSGLASLQQARAIADAAKQQHQWCLGRLEQARVALGNDVDGLNALRERVSSTTLSRIVQLLVSLERRGRLRLPHLLSVAPAGAAMAPSYGGATMQPHLLLGGVATAGMAGVGTSTLVSSLATSFATASTGTALAGLSGAAAESAFLAWLGGGSVAAGGFGVAGGALILNGITLGPAILVGGFVLEAQGSKALTGAVQYAAQVNQAVAQMDAAAAFMEEVRQRVAELSYATHQLWARADAATTAAERLANVFDPERNDHAAVLWQAIQLCQALAQVGRAGLVDEQGGLDSRATALLDGCMAPGGLLS
jgi:hypothetical protein